VSPLDERKEAGRARAQAIAAGYLERGDATGWFDAFYRDAGGELERVPWADPDPHPLLAEWLAEASGDGRRALVVGCGLGEDAEALARAGFAVTAFDVSPTAIAWCGRIWPGSSVDYRTADLFAPPKEWERAFDLVVEIYTLQALPPEPRVHAVTHVERFVAPGGTLLVVTRGRNEDEQQRDEIPWPLTRAELQTFEALGLREAGFLEEAADDQLSRRRWRGEYRRPAGK